MSPIEVVAARCFVQREVELGRLLLGVDRTLAEHAATAHAAAAIARWHPDVGPLAAVVIRFWGRLAIRAHLPLDEEVVR